MDVMAMQSRVTGELYQINAETVQRLLAVTGRGIERYVSLNAEFVSKLAGGPGPEALLELQRHYGESLLAGLRDDVEEGGQIIGNALQKSSRAWQQAWSASSRGDEAPTLAPVATAIETAANVAETLERAVEQPDSELEASLEKVHGIGRAMARQLREAGIETLSQLAAVDISLLSDEEHPLHPMRARLESEHWIDQARNLLDPRRH